MSYLSRLITPLIFITPFSFISNENDYYSLKHFRLIEENEGIKVDILFSTNNKPNRKLTGYIYLYQNESQTYTQNYMFDLDGKDQNFISKIIPYSYFKDESGNITSRSDVDGIGLNIETYRLKYYPNIKDNSHFTLKEENNNKFLSTKYYHQSLDYENDEYNFNHYERFKFLNFFEYEYKEGYSFYDPRRMKFIYENGKDNILHATPHLYIFDTYNVFNRFPYYNDTMYKILPVKIEMNEESQYHLSFENGIYYDPITFEVSPYDINGYRRDEVLYFPTSKFSKLKKINMKLKIEVKGYMDITINGEFELGFNKKIYGDCDESLYCTYLNNDDINGESENIEINI